MSNRLLRRLAYACGIERIPHVVIDAPDYTPLSSGIRCLHLLCDRINRLGVDAAVTARIVDPRLDTPRIHVRTIKTYPTLLDRSIMIYPEVVAGNPFGARNVVRYLLNKPGLFTNVGVEGYGAHDYYLHFADEFRPPGVASRRLRLPLVDKSVFEPPAASVKRSGFLVYSVRYQPDTNAFPEWIDEVTTISRATPRAPSELAKLYQTSRALIVGERTAAVAEALHCGCPVMLLPHREFAFQHVVAATGGHGLAIGLDQPALARASASAPAFAAHYAAQSADADARILEFVADASQYFGLAALRRSTT
jgi:hypothetical protein